METIKKRRLNEIALGFFLLSHPVPVLLHILAVTVFMLLAAWPHLMWKVFLLGITAHAAMQISIAMLNDFCDRRADTLSKRNKPIPRGFIYPHEALIAGFFMILVMLLLLLPLNIPALLISLAYLTLGLTYNLGLKSTPFSGIVFALAIPLIPLYAFASVGRSLPILYWLVPVGALLGVALNLANSLPDIEKDATTGAKTLAVVLGVKHSFFACQVLIVCSSVFIGVLTVAHIVPAQSWVIAPTLICAFLAVVGMLLSFGSEEQECERKLYFYLVALTCIMLAGGWLIGVIF